MKKLFFLLPFFVFCHAYAEEPPKDIKELIVEFGHYDYVCRGTPGMSPDDKVCKIRDEVGDILNNKGWCNEGPKEDSPSYTYQWQKCRNPPKKK